MSGRSLGLTQRPTSFSFPLFSFYSEKGRVVVKKNILFWDAGGGQGTDMGWTRKLFLLIML